MGMQDHLEDNWNNIVFLYDYVCIYTWIKMQGRYTMQRILKK